MLVRFLFVLTIFFVSSLLSEEENYLEELRSGLVGVFSKDDILDDELIDYIVKLGTNNGWAQELPGGQRLIEHVLAGSQDGEKRKSYGHLALKGIYRGDYFSESVIILENVHGCKSTQELLEKDSCVTVAVVKFFVQSLEQFCRIGGASRRQEDGKEFIDLSILLSSPVQLPKRIGGIGAVSYRILNGCDNMNNRVNNVFLKGFVISVNVNKVTSVAPILEYR